MLWWTSNSTTLEIKWGVYLWGRKSWTNFFIVGKEKGREKEDCSNLTVQCLGVSLGFLALQTQFWFHEALVHKQRTLWVGGVLGGGQGLSVDFWKTLAGEQSQGSPHGQEWGGKCLWERYMSQDPFHVQKKNLLLGDKSIESQVLMLNVGFAKQTNK